MNAHRFSTVPSAVRIAQIILLGFLALVIHGLGVIWTFRGILVLLMLIALVAIPIVGLEYRKRWAQVLIAILLSGVGTYQAVQWVLLARSMGDLDAVEYIVYGIFTAFFAYFVYIGISLLFGRSAKDYFYSR